MAVGDFNGDGQPDLVVAADNANYVWVLDGTGTGSFGPGGHLLRREISRTRLSVGDFNGDGKADFATANFGDETVSVLFNQGDGGFSVEGDIPRSGRVPGRCSQAISTATACRPRRRRTRRLLRQRAAQRRRGRIRHPGQLRRRDLSRRGSPSATSPATASWTSPLANLGDGTLGLLVNQGDGGFAYQQAVQAGEQPFALVAADFSGDGLPDLAVTDSTGHFGLALLLNQGDGGFGLPLLSKVGGYPQGIAAGDFNRDGRPDVAAANFNGGTVSVLLNQGNGLGAGTLGSDRLLRRRLRAGLRGGGRLQRGRPARPGRRGHGELPARRRRGWNQGSVVSCPS